MITLTCEVTRWTNVYFMVRKSEAKAEFAEFLTWFDSQGCQVRQLNSDGGGEFTANENAKAISDFQRLFRDRKIRQEFTAPHAPDGSANG